MSRPERKNVDYFPHDVNHGKKMFYIRQKYKNEGYALWFLLLEELGKADNHYLDLREETELMYLSAQLMTTETQLMSVITDLSKIKAINNKLWEQHRIIFSEKFIESIADAYDRRNNKCMNLPGLCEQLQIKLDQKPIKCIENDDNNPQSKVKNSKEKESIYPFESFWNDYDNKKERFKSEKKYSTISEKDRELIKINVPLYVKSTPDCKYRKNPLTYLNGKIWLDPITEKEDLTDPMTYLRKMNQGKI